jgi:LDH2 family malate/lactate/ureidoglycolate dehydrogenase
MTTSGQVLPPAAARAFALDTLRALGMPDEDAAITADSMVWAGLRGSIGHSLVRLEQIARRTRGGALSPTTDWTPIDRRGPVTLMDAGRTWGMLAGTYGMRHAVTAAKTHGAGLTLVRDCDLTSLMAWYASHAVAERMIGFAINNVAPLMPVWGGAQKIIGNQAFAIGAPAGRHEPVYVDMGLGAASLGELKRAAAAGTQLPPGLAVDANGEPTTDPARWRDGGAALPMGGHRGSGLAVIWEVLTGVLAGGNMLTELAPPEDAGQSPGHCLFLLAVDPSAFLPFEEFTRRVDLLVDRLEGSPPAPGVERVRVPGLDRGRLARQRARDGIPLPADHVDRLRKLAAELDVAWPGLPGRTS